MRIDLNHNQHTQVSESSGQAETLYSHTPLNDEEVEPEEVEHSGGDLGKHGHPWDVHTVKIALFQVKHNLKVDAW